ncbi:MAG: iron-sulfur cluster assembly accessory protein [Rhodospirillaceae bacterium]|nr:iron-sulfur cluster assembly accessory protein [Rhodospirillaceae bacterium]
MKPLPKALTLTDRAAARLKELMDTADKPILGLRVGVKARGCSGLSYFMEYAEEQKRFEEKVEDKGVTLLIDPAATMFLIGTEMDYVQEDLGARFVFNNPNEVDRCGCGESFRVAGQEPEQPEQPVPV